MDDQPRSADVSDSDAVALLLHDFNTEYDEPTPGAAVLAQRLRLLLQRDNDILVIGEPPHGLAILRYRDAIWSQSLECYLAELYVAPDHRGQGRGRALMEHAIRLAKERGATSMDLGTAHDDVAARALYESLGFRNTDQSSGGSVNYFYERDL
jgi:ribosomal protein S18 acetylase RimI-like enzyme